MFTSQTIRTYEQLKEKSVQCLMHEHPCMAYDEEIMTAAAVLSGVKIIKIVREDEQPTTINDMIEMGVVRSSKETSEEHKANQSQALAAFIAVFEQQADLHRQYEELFKEVSQPTAARPQGTMYAIV